MNSCLFRFDPHGQEFKSEAETGAISNRAGNANRSSGRPELDFHQLARPQVYPGVEFHASTANLGDQTRHNFARSARQRDEDRRVHMISGISAAAGQVHFELVKYYLLEQAQVQQVCRNG